MLRIIRLQILSFLLIVSLLITIVPGLTEMAYADEQSEDVVAGDFVFRLWHDENNNPTSLHLIEYKGSDAEVLLPTELLYKGSVIKVEALGENVFGPHTPTVKKVIVPIGYEFIGKGAFYGTPNLEEVVIGSSVYFSSDIETPIFGNCPKLKDYWIDGGGTNYELGIGKDKDGKIISGVTAHIIKDGLLDNHLKEENDRSRASGGNEIFLDYGDWDEGHVGDVMETWQVQAGGTNIDPKKQYGKDGTPYAREQM